MNLETVQTKQSPTADTLQSTIVSLVILMRPQQWIKNLLVFVGLVFSRSLTDWHNIRLSVIGFLVFCAASSGIYIFNDLCDLEADKNHPVKRKRPLASGMLNLNVARGVMALLFVVATAGALSVSWLFSLVIAAYFALCLSYSLGLKSVVILDVMLIALGFVLRAISGAVILHVEVSQWLVLCTSMLALLIGFGKRRHELAILGDGAESHRISLTDYSTEFLNMMMAVCAGAAVLTYALYTMAEETVSRFGTRNLLLTLPFVIYGIFRYLFLVHERQEGGDPVHLFLHDRPTQLNLLFWAMAIVAVIYTSHIPELLLR
jgi:4-hydroxybenzoate polyprenyltransferase